MRKKNPGAALVRADVTSRSARRRNTAGQRNYAAISTGGKKRAERTRGRLQKGRTEVGPTSNSDDIREWVTHLLGPEYRQLVVDVLRGQAIAGLEHYQVIEQALRAEGEHPAELDAADLWRGAPWFWGGGARPEGFPP